MATVSLYFDARRLNEKGEGAVKLTFCNQKPRAWSGLPVKVRADQWDPNSKNGPVINHPKAKALNLIIKNAKTRADALLLKLAEEGSIHKLSSKEIRDLYEGKDVDGNTSVEGEVAHVFKQVLSSKKHSGTRQVYEGTLNSIMKYDQDFEKKNFSDIDRRWTEGWLEMMRESGLKASTIAERFTKLKAVFNYAIDEEITDRYPFRKIVVRQGQSRKRALTVESIRKIIRANIESKCGARYRDYWVLTFLLVGINMADLLRLKEGDVRDGRIEYNRAKTGRHYSIRIEPEAREYLERLKGGRLLLSLYDEKGRIQAAKRKIMAGMHSLKRYLNEIDDGIVIDELTTYWARHTWATIARSLGVSIDDIALALGHSNGHQITNIYIDEDVSRIDAANRKVIDWVFHNKR